MKNIFSEGQLSSSFFGQTPLEQADSITNPVVHLQVFTPSIAVNSVPMLHLSSPLILQVFLVHSASFLDPLIQLQLLHTSSANVSPIVHSSMSGTSFGKQAYKVHIASFVNPLEGHRQVLQSSPAGIVEPVTQVTASTS